MGEQFLVDFLLLVKNAFISFVLIMLLLIAGTLLYGSLHSLGWYILWQLYLWKYNIFRVLVGLPPLKIRNTTPAKSR